MIIPGAEIQITPAFGWQGGPEFDTKIARTVAGRESRMARNDRVVHRFNLPFLNIPNDAFLQELKSLFLVARGRCFAFLAKDHSDYLAEDAPFAVGDGVDTVFQLAKTVTVGAGAYRREINKPVSGAIVSVNGTPTAVTIDTATGLVTFAAPPANGAALTWSGEFRVPVRFNSDALPMSIDNRFGAEGRYAMNGSVELVEVFDE